MPQLLEWIGVLNVTAAVKNGVQFYCVCERVYKYASMPDRHLKQLQHHDNTPTMGTHDPERVLVMKAAARTVAVGISGYLRVSGYQVS
ncbi:hypothetical protein I7I51_08719 [Histoplasma capsulatum]|uniref:Uncharacterized protein n=1 Tax=Ajellomyces capsulatus TaxID=5037 RepID=A0A8A1LYM0_AJECA|nr:hypothetical protein I7I51_08719 [Histoplasma capsulatum]